MRDRIDFLKQSLRHIRNTGSITRSSQYLCEAIVRKIDPATAKVVIELGPGDGVITKHLLERLAPDARLIIFEINDAFVAQLRRLFESDQRVTLIHDSAENMALHLDKLGIESADYIVSGIPFVMLPEELRLDIITKCRQCLCPDGRFIQFHYSPLLFPLYRRVFGKIKVNFVPLNIPPALVITCTR